MRQREFGPYLSVMEHRFYRRDQHPDIEVLLDTCGCAGGLRMLTQPKDGSQRGMPKGNLSTLTEWCPGSESRGVSRTRRPWVAASG